MNCFTNVEKFVNKGFYNKALKYLKNLLLEIKNPDERIEIYLAISSVLRRKNKPKKALFYIEKSLNLALDDEQFADIYCEEALLLRMLLRYEESLKKLRKARIIYKKINDKIGIAYTYWIEGGIKRYWGRSREGLKSFEKAYNLFSKVKDITGKGYSLCGIGGTSRIIGEFKKSLESYKKANFIFKRKKDKFGLAYSHCGIGSAYRMLGNTALSEENYKKAIKLYKQLKDHWNMAYSIWGYLMLKQKYSNLKNPLLQFRKLEKIFKEFKDKRGVLYVNFLRMNFYLNRGAFSRVKKLILNSEKIIETLNLKDEKKFMQRFKKNLKEKTKEIILIP